MSNISDFSPFRNGAADVQLAAFIAWAKDTLPKGIQNQRVHPGINWDLNSWHSYGVNSSAFIAHRHPTSANKKTKTYMQPPFMDFAKALVVHHTLFRMKKSAQTIIQAARPLEVALFEATGTSDVTRLTAAIFNRACEILQSEYPNGDTAYTKGNTLEQIVTLMRSKKLLAKPFRWKSPLQAKGLVSLNQQRRNRKEKLPSRESILALGELFNNNLTSPLDITTVSACAVLLSQPSRIGELADVEHDCIIFKDNPNGSQRMFLRWYSEKGFGATVKPVVAGMEPAIERAIALMSPITEEARLYAAWLEEHPDEFPPHEAVPLKSLDEPLTYQEALAALKTKTTGSPRRTFKATWLVSFATREGLSPKAQAVLKEIQEGWDNSDGQRVFVNGVLSHYEFQDKSEITLRKLNVLVREKYLPKDFPYTTPAEDGKNRVKYRDALFTVRTGQLADETKVCTSMQYDFGVRIAPSQARMTAQLGGASHRQSIFQRHGYGSLKVNTHAFRHELNTEMHRAGLSQLLIDAFSGRTSRGSVYNHETIEERTQFVAAVHPKTKLSSSVTSFEKLITNQPLKMSDLSGLDFDGPDRIIHRTHLGICIHPFETEPCPKMGACMTCGNLGCVKGDDVKLANLKEEAAYLKQRYDKAVTAEFEQIFGASEWRTKTGLDMLKCNALIQLLESPDLNNGDIVWNIDSGWSLTKNAAAMSGLLKADSIESMKPEIPLSLDQLAALLDEIEV